MVILEYNQAKPNSERGYQLQPNLKTYPSTLDLLYIPFIYFPLAILQGILCPFLTQANPISAEYPLDLHINTKNVSQLIQHPAYPFLTPGSPLENLHTPIPSNKI